MSWRENREICVFATQIETFFLALALRNFKDCLDLSFSRQDIRKLCAHANYVASKIFHFQNISRIFIVKVSLMRKPSSVSNLRPQRSRERGTGRTYRTYRNQASR